MYILKHFFTLNPFKPENPKLTPLKFHKPVEPEPKKFDKLQNYKLLLNSIYHYWDSNRSHYHCIVANTITLEHANRPKYFCTILEVYLTYLGIGFDEKSSI